MVRLPHGGGTSIARPRSAEMYGKGPAIDATESALRSASLQGDGSERAGVERAKELLQHAGAWPPSREGRSAAPSRVPKALSPWIPAARVTRMACQSFLLLRASSRLEAGSDRSLDDSVTSRAQGSLWEAGTQSVTHSDSRDAPAKAAEGREAFVRGLRILHGSESGVTLLLVALLMPAIVAFLARPCWSLAGPALRSSIGTSSRSPA